MTPWSLRARLRRVSPERLARVSRTVAAYDDPLVRAYCQARFIIIHQRFLDELLQYLPQRGAVLELGCGFGLFALYFGQSLPELTITGLDLNAQRIDMARKAARKLEVANVHFEQGDARALELNTRYQCVYMLDIIHHVPPELVPGLLEQLYACLEPGGILLIKDVDTFPRHQKYFTWALDVLMTRGERPDYWSAAVLTECLRDRGFQVFSHAMVDLLPYPHRLYVCHKSRLEHLAGTQEPL